MIFNQIQSIDPNVIESWEKKIFLSFDLDWCHDEVLENLLDFLDLKDINSTIFITHDTELLKKIRADKKIELGVHPNFNPLLSGDFQYGKNIDDVMKYYMEIVPEAISVRSHSLTQGGQFIKTFEDNGIKYECNSLINPNGGTVKPYKFSNKLIKVPHIFEDDVRDWYDEEFNLLKYLKYDGLRVFDFHPIHIFLNTEKLSRYEEARPFLKNPNKLKNLINKKNYGTRNYLEDILEYSLNRESKQNI